MAKTTHTFEFFGPLDDIVEQFTGTDTIDASAPNVILRKTVDIEDSIFADAKMEYKSKHWIYVGLGDQTDTTSVIELYRNSSLSTGDDSNLVDIAWDTEVLKNNITHSTSVDADEITITTSGRYNVFGMIKLTNSLLLTGIRVALLVNDNIVMDISSGVLTPGETSVPINNSLTLSNNDVVKLQIASVGAGSVSVVTGSANTYLKIVAV